jgi:hypothetical protein
MAEIVPASYFGFRPVVQNEPLLADQLALRATDSSAAARNLENYITNWRERTGPRRLSRRGDPKALIVQFEAGLYLFDYLDFKANPDVFYPNLGVEIHGAGQYATIFRATQSNAAQFIGMSGSKNWIELPILRKLMVRGFGENNPNQVGIFLNPDFNVPLGFGGLTVPHWDRVSVINFHREQIWLRGGSSSYLIPFQYGIWDNVRCDAYNPNYPAFKLTGQIGPPFIFRNLECYHVRQPGAVAAYVGLDKRTNIPVTSVDLASNSLVFSEPHRFTSTDVFTIDPNTGRQYGGLSNETTYYVIKLDDYRIRAASTLANSQSGTAITLTAATGTAFVHSAQTPGLSIGSVQTIFDTPTFQSADIGIEVDNGSVDIRSMHIEETNTTIKLGVSGDVSLTDASIQNGAYTNCVFDGSGGTNGGSICVQGRVYFAGATNIIAKNYFGNVNLTNAHFIGDYPTTGSGVAENKQLAFVQLGNPSNNELNVRGFRNNEFILNEGTNVIKFIRDLAFPGKEVSFHVWPPLGIEGNPNYVEFDSTGNIRLFGKDFNGGTIRFPVNSFITFKCTSIGSKWSLESFTIPPASKTWTMTGTIAANSSITTTVTCFGARVGDLAPVVGLSSVLDNNLSLSAQVTSTNTVTVKITNNNSSAVTLPTDPTVTVLQQR